jgi:RNA polymerase sporulation-specific sigma factor
MDHTIALIKQSHEGDEKARAQLVEENIGLIWCVVKRFYGRGQDPDDLFQIGSIGLLKAIDKFDLNYDVRFSTYAVPMISGEIRRFLRDDGMVKVSRVLKENGYRISRAAQKIQEETGREATLQEIAQKTGLTEEEIAEAMDANAEVESIFRTIYQKDGNEVNLAEKTGESDETEKEGVLNRMVLEQLLEQLDDVESRLIRLRYFDEKTQNEIAKILDVSQVQVSRMEKKILGKMRKSLVS